MSDEVLGIFRTAGAIKEGHFLLASGLHSPVYWEKFRVLQHPHLTERLCRLIIQHFTGRHIDAVAGPTTGGIILAFEAARQLGVRGIFAEKTGQARIFRRDFSIAAGERILVVDDILTTGSSVRETIAAVIREGGTVIGVGVLVNRTAGHLGFNLPLFSCLHSPTTAYPPEECPLCAARVPLVKPGASTCS